MRWCLLLALFFISCTSQPTAAHILEAHGFHQYELKGKDMFGCGKGDWFFGQRFVATRDGQTFTGVVCSGWLKGATLRFN